MALVPAPENIKWFTGEEVEAQKSLLRQTDATYLMQILKLSLTADGPLHDVVKNMQRVCEQARKTVAKEKVDNAFTTADIPIWEGYSDDLNDFSINVRLIAGMNLMRDGTVINPLALGDFCRAFADMATSVKEGTNKGLYAIGLLIRQMQNPQAFNKTTNRIRIKRRDILEQVPGVGITQWYLPSDDVLGTIDRLLGYYETGDISGTTTDGLVVLAALQTLDPGPEFGSVDKIKPRIAELINNGLAFNSFAGMVIQMHHSLPECMMAINLMPRYLGVPDSQIKQIYSPLLSNTGLNEIKTTYKAWQQARYSVLGKDGDARPDNAMRMLIVLQDIFQMPNHATDLNEVAFIMPFEFTDMTNNIEVFGSAFYNTVVHELNTSNPGPAITLEKLSDAIFHLWFADRFNAGIDNAKVPLCVQKGMALPQGTPPADADYDALVAPFLAKAAYGQVLSADVEDL